MKTDRYKDWESKFFDGEELTPEEDLFLKNESDNPYFSFLKEEKKEKLNISFQDFLKKAEAPKVVALPAAKKKSYTQYWMAASLVMLMGITGFWMLDNHEQIEPQIAKHIEATAPIATPSMPVIETVENQQPVLAQQQEEPKTVKDTQNIESKPTKAQYASHQPKKTPSNPVQNQVNSDTEYNPNYVIINGKPIYSEQEAIAVTEDTFNYFASNVTQTINHAESAQNQVDFYRILNF